MGAKQKSSSLAGDPPSVLLAQALGREVSQKDWISDIELRLAMIIYRPSRNELTAILLERFKHRAGLAATNWAILTRDYQNSSDAKRKEVARFLDALNMGKQLDTGAPAIFCDAIRNEVEAEVDQIMDEEETLRSEWALVRMRSDVSADPELADSLNMLQESLTFLSSERGSILREIRNRLAAFSLRVEVVPPVVSLLHGWILHQIGQDFEEPVEVLGRLTESGPSPFSAYAVLRLLTEYLTLAGDTAKCSQLIGRARELNEDPDCLVEAALVGVTTNDAKTTLNLVNKAALSRPGAFLRIISDPRCLKIGNPLIEIYLNVLEQTRQEAQMAASRWKVASEEIATAQEEIELPISAPYELVNGHNQVNQRIGASDLFLAVYLFRNSLTSTEGLRAAVQTSVISELNKRGSAVSIARKAADSVAGARESRVKQAEEAYRAIKQEAQSSSSKLGVEGKKTEGTALCATVGGGTLLTLYLVSNAVIDPKSIPIGITMPLGILILVGSLIPLFFGFWLYFNSYVKKGAVESKLKKGISDAERELDNASKEADDFYREQIARNKKILAEAEGELKKAEAAMKLFNINEVQVEKQRKQKYMAY